MAINPNSLYPRTVPVAGRLVNIVYLDINAQYGLDNNQLLLENILAINGQILHLILTPIGSVPFEPEFGSNIPGLIFDQPTGFTTMSMEDGLLLAMHRWLPVVQVDFRRSNIFMADDPSESGYVFQLYYSVGGLPSAVSVDFRFNS